MDTKMTPNNPLDLEALERLHAAATPGKWVTTTGYAGAVRRKFLHRGNDTDGEAFQRRNGALDCSDADVECTSALHNAFPAIRDRIRELEGEVDKLGEESAYIQQQLEWVEENGETYTKESLLDFIRRTINGLTHTAVISEALAARDARLKREGAIEVYEQLALADWQAVDQRDRMREEAGKLREAK